MDNSNIEKRFGFLQSTLLENIGNLKLIIKRLNVRRFG
jgi:hypothetical protein